MSCIAKFDIVLSVRRNRTDVKVFAPDFGLGFLEDKAVYPPSPILGFCPADCSLFEPRRRRGRTRAKRGLTMFPVPIGKAHQIRPASSPLQSGEPLQGVDGISGVIW